MTSTPDPTAKALAIWATLTDAECDTIYFSAFPDSPLDEAPLADDLDYLAEVLDAYDDAAGYILAAIESTRANA